MHNAELLRRPFPTLLLCHCNRVQRSSVALSFLLLPIDLPLFSWLHSFKRMKTQTCDTKRLALVISLVALAFGFSGCMFPKAKKYLSKNINVAGAFTHSPNSFAPVEAGTLHVQSDELWYRRDFSGKRTTFMWGLVTFTDY